MGKSKIFLIPGYGTNHTIFNRLKIDPSIPFEIIYTDFLDVNKKTTLEEYAENFVKRYHISEGDIIIGMSFGAMLGIEIHKKVSTSLIIGISTIKTQAERPLIFKILEYSKLYMLFSPILMKKLLWLTRPFFGCKQSYFKWYKEAFTKSYNSFLSWGLYQCIHWKNLETPKSFIHIHGTKDPLFPINRIARVEYKIKNGNHAMLRLKSDEISDIINKELLKLKS